MANDIDIYSKKNVKKVFQKSDWKRLSRDLDILPLGLHRMELRLLRALSEQPFTRLTNLAAKLGMSRSVIQRDFEMFLQKESLFEVQPLGRQLTKKGQQYLKNYEKEYGTEK